MSNAGSRGRVGAEPSHGIQLGVVQEVLLALLAEEATIARAGDGRLKTR
ncbi:hypothetical protein [Actinoplanes sp. NPDC026623]